MKLILKKSKYGVLITLVPGFKVYCTTYSIKHTVTWYS